MSASHESGPGVPRDAAVHSVAIATRASRIAAVAFGILLLVLAAAPLWAGRADLRLLGEVYTFIVLATLWNLLAGYAGLISVGQQAYVGLGGYSLFVLTAALGLNPVLAIILAGPIGALAAMVLAPLLFRLHGAHFTIGTWVVAEIFRLGFGQVGMLGGGSGASLPIGVVRSIAVDREAREFAIYWLILGAALVTLAAAIALLRSRTGLALMAIRDNAIAGESLGIATLRTKRGIYVAAAALTSVIGALIFLQKLRISPDAAFNLNDWTAYVIFIAVIGGLGTIEGPIVGTILFFLLRQYLADLGAVYILILGATAVAVMLRAPGGLWGAFASRTGIVLVPIRRRVVTTTGT